MKFRNKKTGEVFPTITEAWTAFMCPGPCGDCNLQRGSTCEKEWIEAHPHEAARLMGYEVVEDDSCKNCTHYKGESICGLHALNVEINPDEKCIAWEKRKEANMDKPDQQAKADQGKPCPSLVPVSLIEAVTAIRMYGSQKYGDPENWRKVEPQRYRDALYRHWLAYLKGEKCDQESGLPHLWHLACNAAFLIEMEETDGR